ncbi:MAG: hypothetical protein IJ399_03290 [Bacilli bacterium]|nr:hypothetical protein [Bacilli bacterium]
MKALEKTKNELVKEHDRLCDVHDELLKKYKSRVKAKTLFDKKFSKIKDLMELRKLEARIDVLNDAIYSVDAKISLFNEMPKVGIDSSKNTKNLSSSSSIKKSLDSMKTVIEKEYKKLDVLAQKKVLSHYFVDERRKGLKKYELGFNSLMGAMFGMGVSIFTSSLYQSFLLPFVFMGVGACVADIFSVLKTNRNIKLFNKLNDELKGDKLELSSENGMQEVFDLSSEINKKCHDIMVMETIYKEQERTLEEAIDYESKSKFENELKVKPGYVQSSTKQQDDYGLICNSGRWAGYPDIPSDYPSKILVEGSSRTERDDTIEMGELYRHLEDDGFQPKLRK